MRFFFLLTACGKGAVGGTFRTCCPTAHPHTPGLILSASDGIWNMLFSTCSHTSRWVRFRFGGCVSLVVAHVRPTHIALHEHHVMQFPFLPERRGRGAPMAPVPLKRKRDTSNEPKTDPMKRAYMLVPDEAKLWFVEIHAYQARVHGKSLACNIRRAKDLVLELFGPRTSLMPSQPCFVSASPLGSTSTAVCCASLTLNSGPPEIGRAVSSQLAAIMEARGDLQPPHIARERKLLQRRVIHLCARFGISQDRIWNLDERTQIVYEKKTDRVRPHGPIFPHQLVSHTWT